MVMHCTRRLAPPLALAALLVLAPAASGCGGDDLVAANLGGPPVSLSVSTGSGRPAEVVTGSQLQLVATIRDGDGRPVAAAVRWSVADETVATVAHGGRVRGVAEGVTIVRAESGALRDSVSVTVRARGR
jgi:hypothetical protein